ncbi:MAG: nucleoside recognition domain-containing protein [Myxococcota bacterium]
MLNAIWLALVLIAVVYAAFTGQMKAVAAAGFESAESAVGLVIRLAGFMIFMLGVMRVVRDAGLLAAIARGLAPLLRRLFPQVPADHPAMGAMIMNMASNMLGMGNAATPFGLKAMVELNRLNPNPGVATDPMVLFLAINTSAITLMAPTGTMAVRAAAGSAAPGAIWVPTLIATICSTVGAVTAYYLLRGRSRFAAKPLPDAERPTEVAEFDTSAEEQIPEPNTTPLRSALAYGIAALLVAAVGWSIAFPTDGRSPAEVAKEVAEHWLIPLLVALLLLAGLRSGVRVYESMVAGAREGLDVVVRIVPYLVVILVAVGMFRASGALDLLIAALDPVTSAFGFPAAALPMALLRPLSGSGAFAVMAEILEAEGADSFVGMLASTLQGSTETTFYVLTVYCGAAGIREVRHALPACLIGDLCGAAGATFACHLFFG